MQVFTMYSTVTCAYNDLSLIFFLVRHQKTKTDKKLSHLIL